MSQPWHRRRLTDVAHTGFLHVSTLDLAKNLSPNLLVGLYSAGLILRSGACPAILELLGERTYELEVCNCERGGGGAPIKCGAIAARDMRLPARRLRRQV